MSSQANSQHPILLPKTSFPMKGNLQQKEPEIIQFWQEKNIYQKLINKQKKQSLFNFIDGPPYANGNLHIGHALNKILKDIVVKYKNLSGYLCPFIPVWDCHGLPIEMQALKKNKNKNIQPDQIRKICREEALHWVRIQKEQFKRLGVLAAWDQCVLTLDPDYEAAEIKAMAEVAEKKLLYRGKKPVYWCCALKTAIASSEVEYREHKSPSIYVKFPAPKITQHWNLDKPCSLVIWTTTPWTLPANQAICLKSDIVYGLFDSGNEYLIIAKDLQTQCEKNTGLNLKPLKFFKGKELEQQKARHPFMNKDSLIILGDHVSQGEGTGCVHTAPGHGIDDFIVGSLYNLKVSVPVDPSGCFTDEVPEWVGLHVFKANPLIIEKLKEKDCLLAKKDIVHSYPYNPRSSFPLIFRATDQWFISFDKSEYPVREKSLKEVENHIQFYPQWGKQRLKSMVSHSPDWCISRQRHWGVPIPVFYCKNCQQPLVSPKIMNDLARHMKTSKQGIEYWFSKDTSELLPANQACSKCQSSDFTKGQDIVDVWFDSGICHFVFYEKFGQKSFPADIYLEGSDQHRGWFQTSLNSSVCIKGTTPFKTLLTHCFVNDSEGHKMSKSKGNVLSLQNILKQKGAEIIRLWVASEDYSQDLQISTEIFDRVTESYRSFRNTIRFMLGNLQDFQPEKDLLNFTQMIKTDQWILSKLHNLVQKNRAYYEAFQFHQIYQSLNTFFKVDLSSLYLDILKDRLYTFKQKGLERRSAQTALYHLLTNLLQLMSPITTFLCEEAYQYLPGKNKESILLNDFPSPPAEWNNQEINELFSQFLAIRQMAYLPMEEMRKSNAIGSSLEAQLKITLPEEIFAKMEKHSKELKEVLVVSYIHLQPGKELKVEAKKAEGSKCQRCWHYDKGLNREQLCSKCVVNVT